MLIHIHIMYYVSILHVSVSSVMHRLTNTSRRRAAVLKNTVNGAHQTVSVDMSHASTPSGRVIVTSSLV